MAVEPKNKGFFSHNLYILTPLRYFEVLLSLFTWGHEIKWLSGRPHNFLSPLCCYWWMYKINCMAFGFSTMVQYCYQVPWKLVYGSRY